MTPAPEHKDTFAQYDILYGFLQRPLAQVQEICGGDIFRLKHMLKEHIQPLKGEIRKNCQAHSKQKDTEYYLKSIKSKLKEDLLNHLLGKEVDPEYVGTPIYPTNDRTPIEEKFTCEIRASFNSLFNYLDDLLPKDGGKQPMTSEKGKKYQKTSHPSSYTLNPAVNEAKFLESFHLLKGKFISEDTTDEQFLACFSGNPVSKKVSWNCQRVLYYFIRQLHQKELIDEISNGIWETAALCFISKKGGDLNPGNLGRTRYPTDKKCRKIDDVIAIFWKNT